MTDEILSLIDRERAAFSRVSEDCVDALIQEQKARADQLGYALEWKVYGHDTPSDLVRRLVAAGFEAEPVEQVMVLELKQQALARFPASERALIKRVEDAAGLDAVAEISRENERTNVDRERARLQAALENDPQSVSLYVAYVAGEAAACGRLHVGNTRGFGELCGGRTKTKFRNQGLYLALVRARLAEAIERKLPYVTVDALPTSEPLLVKRGFGAVTWTQPLRYDPERPY
jgi:hypothetical protein